MLRCSKATTCGSNKVCSVALSGRSGSHYNGRWTCCSRADLNIECPNNNECRTCEFLAEVKPLDFTDLMKDAIKH